MKYDDITWHLNKNFPADSPQEYAAVHIALFMKWCFVKGWAGEMHLEDESENIRKVIEGKC